MSARHTARHSRIREAARQETRRAEQERNSQGQEAQTFTGTFTFTDGTSITQEFQTEADQQRAEETFNIGRQRGDW